MRIAMLGHKRVPSHEGGIEVVVEELAARMVEKGHQVTCFNRTGQHVSGKEYEVQKLDEYRGIRIRHVPTLDKKGLAAVTSSFFARTLVIQLIKSTIKRRITAIPNAVEYSAFAMLR